MNHPLNQTGKKIQNYIFNYSDFLGAGNFSKCYKGLNEVTNQTVAIKIVQLNSLKSQKLQQLLFQQIQILKKLNHPSVLRCFQIFTSNRNCYIITELCNEGNLQNMLKSRGGHMRQEDVSPIVKDLYDGLRYLGQHGIVHRDFKSANIFLQNGRAKIADFGFAKEIKHNFRDLNIGSPLYMTPEGILHNMYGPKTQVWALGILVYELFHGTSPYNLCKSEDDLKRSVSTPLNWNQLRPDLSQDVKEFILTCLQVNEQKRASIEDLANLGYMRRINHQFNNSSNGFLTMSTNLNQRSPTRSIRNDGFRRNQQSTQMINVQRTNNNFRSTLQNNFIARNSPNNRNKQHSFKSVDARQTYIPANNRADQSIPKQLLAYNHPQLRSPKRSMTIMGQGQVPNGFAPSTFAPQPFTQQNSKQLLPRQNAFIPLNRNVHVPYPQQKQIVANNENQYQQGRPRSSFQSNGGNLTSSKSTQLQGFNNITNNILAEDQQKTKQKSGLKNSLSSHPIFKVKITFKQSIFFIHHCRLIFKFLCLLHSTPLFDEEFYLSMFKYLLTLLNQLHILSVQNSILIDGQKSSLKMQKLNQVNIQYLTKYKKQLNSHNYHIQPQLCQKTKPMKIHQVLFKFFNQKLNTQIFTLSRKSQLNPTDENILLLGHLSLVIMASLEQIDKAINSKNYEELIRFKEIQNVLNMPKEDFTCSSYRSFREKYVR